MEPAAVVTVIGVVLAVGAIALYLIIISVILKNVYARLVIILGAVVEVSEKSAPAGEIIEAINADLAHGHAAVAAAAERLHERAAAEADQFADTGPIDRGGAERGGAERGGSVAAPLPADRGGWWQR